jgi:hypothetical protein
MRQVVMSDKTDEITAASISSSASATTSAYGCKNLMMRLVSLFCA